MPTGRGSTERRPKSIEERVRGWWRCAFGARPSVVEEAGFKMPFLHIYLYWAILVTLLVAGVLALLVTATMSYDANNYRYVLSAELQSVAAIFALVITGSLVATQIVVGTTPRIMVYVPVKELVVAVVVNVVAMAFDVVALAGLPDSATCIEKFGINFAVVLNGEAVLTTLAYVWWTFHWTQPRTYLTALLNRMDQTDDLQSQREIMVAIEELGLHAGQRGHVQTCEDVTRSVVTAARLLLEKPDLLTDEALEEGEHPFDLLPETLGSLGQGWAREGLDGTVVTIASALGSIALGYSEHDERLVDAQFPIAMTDIIRSCLRHSRETALHDFLACKEAALKRLKEASAQRAMWFWGASIHDEIRLCTDAQLVEGGGSVVRQLELLAEAAAAGQVDAALVRGLLALAEDSFGSAGMLTRVPVLQRQTLAEAIQAARARLDELQGE